MKHKHCDVIKAWADGAEIQLRSDDDWIDVGGKLSWFEDSEYRVKPEPKPDIYKWYFVNPQFVQYINPKNFDSWNLKLTFDGESGKIKSAEVLK